MRGLGEAIVSSLILAMLRNCSSRPDTLLRVFFLSFAPLKSVLFEKPADNGIANLDVMVVLEFLNDLLKGEVSPDKLVVLGISSSMMFENIEESLIKARACLLKRQTATALCANTVAGERVIGESFQFRDSFGDGGA